MGIGAGRDDELDVDVLSADIARDRRGREGRSIDFQFTRVTASFLRRRTGTEHKQEGDG